MSTLVRNTIAISRTHPLLHPARTRSQLLGIRWMSVRPSAPPLPSISASPVPPRKKVNLDTLQSLYASKTPITMLTAYDYPSSIACSSSPLVDITLIGDSLAQVCLGYESTTQLTLDEMIHHAKAVKRGNKHPFLVADMPFGSYTISIEDAVRNAIRLVREAGVESVKLEGGREIAPVVGKLKEVGIPVLAHVGLQPQKHTALSGYKVQGKRAEGAQRVLADAIGLQDAGAWGVVVEAVPKELGKYITDVLRIPTVGIGAGPWTSGQVLVYDDVMGTWAGHKAKFVRRFANMKEVRDKGAHAYAEAVRDRTFPHEENESYTMDKEELSKFLEEAEGRLP